ncbi:MAG: Asp-tRNA(Asn)/Glu-tRNA(Gln) amidotransferase subunit GatA [Sphingobacteriales bacterium]|nr:MAG: Asp-tRNA(Asn)/Glu-tRNA(Gln) amidotransferase subunit GatA [Sphingobacteriales bacterium]
MPTYQTYSTYRAALAQGQTTCLETVQAFLTEIDARKNINAFLEVYNQEALDRASEIDAIIKRGEGGKLAGMVIAVKDNICYKGHKVSASSKILQGFESLYSSTAVERLLAEDAIIIGRTNCDEFAMGSSNENSAYGVVRNPLNENLVPGGSSGGSAAAVAANLCHAALGSDTGGSIRQPASFCGVIGMRPTYARISRHGLLAFASSFDQIGPVTHTVEDCALLLEVMSGHDEHDATVSTKEVPEYSKAFLAEGTYSVALLEDCLYNEGVDKEIQARFDEIISATKNDGHTYQSATFPYLDYVVPAYYVLATAEASSNLGRFAGMTYGYRSPDAKTLDEVIVKSRSEGFGEEVKRRIMLGTFVLSEGYYDAYYSKAQKVRRMIKDYSNQLLAENDFIILPTSPSTAFALGDNTDDPIQMYLADIFTLQSALAGLPSISLPLGVHSNGMPFGVQLIGRAFEEEKLFAFSNYLMNQFSNR